jgi:hypothetical protein
MTWGQIAASLQMSAKNLSRRRNDIDYQDSAAYSDITDDDLDSILSRLVEEYPYKGYRCFQTLLEVRGHRLTRGRINTSLSRVDPEGKATAIYFCSNSDILVLCRSNEKEACDEETWNILYLCLRNV